VVVEIKRFLKVELKNSVSFEKHGYERRILSKVNL